MELSDGEVKLKREVDMLFIVLTIIPLLLSTAYVFVPLIAGTQCNGSYDIEIYSDESGEYQWEQSAIALSDGLYDRVCRSSEIKGFASPNLKKAEESVKSACKRFTACQQTGFSLKSISLPGALVMIACLLFLAYRVHVFIADGKKLHGVV